MGHHDLSASFTVWPQSKLVPLSDYVLSNASLNEFIALNHLKRLLVCRISECLSKGRRPRFEADEEISYMFICALATKETSEFCKCAAPGKRDADGNLATALVWVRMDEWIRYFLEKHGFGTQVNEYWTSKPNHHLFLYIPTYHKIRNTTKTYTKKSKILIMRKMSYLLMFACMRRVLWFSSCMKGRNAGEICRIGCW